MAKSILRTRKIQKESQSPGVQDLGHVTGITRIFGHPETDAIIGRVTDVIAGAHRERAQDRDLLEISSVVPELKLIKLNFWQLLRKMP